MTPDDVGGVLPGARAWQLMLSPAAAGVGLRGVYTDAGVTVRFETCSTATGFRSVVSKADGAPITEVVKDGEAVSCRVAGVLVGADLTETQRAEIDAVLASAEGRVAPKVHQALLRVALTGQPGAMSALPADFTSDDAA